MNNYYQRPRAFDFDEPPPHSRDRRSPPNYYQRRTSPIYEPPSPNYPHHSDPDPDPPQQNQQRQRRFTPEESLDQYHQHSSRYDQPRINRHSQSDGYRQGGRDDFFEKRRMDRENATVDFWPKSPDQPYGEEKKRHHSSKKEERTKDKKKKDRHGRSERKLFKHHYTDDETQSDKSDQRRHHKSQKKHKSSKHRKSHKHDNSEEEGASNSDHVIKEQVHREKSKSNLVEEEDLWVEREAITTLEAPTTTRKASLSGPLRHATVEVPELIEEEEEEEDVGEVGPMPYNHVTGKAMDPKEFGRALRPGEGSAMAAFIEAGERIPRRGEIGLTGNEIEKFENVGYVMSGSRHRRMNAVRIRKENQVISAEEKRGILKMQAEEKAKREGQIISSFRELVDTKLQETG